MQLTLRNSILLELMDIYRALEEYEASLSILVDSNKKVQA